MYGNQINCDIDPFAAAQIARKQAEHMAAIQKGANMLGAEPMRMPELMREAERLEVLLGQLSQISGEIEARLTPVLRGSVPSPIANGLALEGNAAPFACRLAEMSDRMQTSLSWLRDILDRLEV